MKSALTPELEAAVREAAREEVLLFARALAERMAREPATYGMTFRVLHAATKDYEAGEEQDDR